MVGQSVSSDAIALNFLKEELDSTDCVVETVPCEFWRD